MIDLTQNSVKLVIALILIVAAIIFIEDPFNQPESLDDEENVGIAVGQIAPRFVLETLSGDTLDLRSFRGKPVLVNFWASWCPPCRVEMPDLQRAHDTGKIIVIGVNLQESRETAQGFVDELELTFPMVLDPDGSVKRKYDIFTQPVSYFLDKDGVIRATKFGPLTSEELDEKIELMSN